MNSLNKTYDLLITELQKPRLKRNGFQRRRKQPFSISDERINELYDRYFPNLSLSNKQFTFKVLPNDLDEMLYLLRIHFKLWIEVEDFSITLYSKFPEGFELTQEVNTNNHPHTPIAIAKGTLMEFTEDPYGVVNFKNGIPLTTKLLYKNNAEPNSIKPYIQVDYPFIKAVF